MAFKKVVLNSNKKRIRRKTKQRRRRVKKVKTARRRTSLKKMTGFKKNSVPKQWIRL